VTHEQVGGVLRTIGGWFRVFLRANWRAATCRSFLLVHHGFPGWLGSSQEERVASPQVANSGGSLRSTPATPCSSPRNSVMNLSFWGRRSSICERGIRWQRRGKSEAMTSHRTPSLGCRQRRRG